ncbi:MAG: GNAT family N-acetyltransferase [Blautia sp.]|nr:GNAT family N-acetyltransferase [Blautia sp.]MCM1200883.1 GNAT family N-acetyltransferase [Bacteroides fragilis]
MEVIERPSEELVYLRPIQETDTERVVAWRNKERVRHNFIYQKPFTEEGHLNWLRTQVEPGHVVQFIICEKASGRAVGSVYFRDIDRERGCAEYGIFIGEDDALGRGYGTQAAKLALACAFEKLRLRSVFLRVFADNAGARKSYEKAGFALIKDRREEVTMDGVTRTVVFYSIEGR